MKALIGLLVVLVVIGAALVAVDRIGEGYTSNRIAQRLTNQLNLTQSPKVDIPDVPFLTQWASGHYQEIDITFPTVTAQSVTVNDVQVTVKDIHTKPFLTSGSDLVSATAGSIDLSGVVPFSALPLPSGFTASASGSQLKVSGSISVLGTSVPVTAIENVSLQGSTVVFNPTNIQAGAAGFSFDVSGAVGRQLTLSLNVSSLPLGVHMTGVTVGSSGLEAMAAGQNVPLATA